MIPTLARPGDVAPGQFGPISRAPAARTSSTAGIMSSAGIPSVMQKIVAIPAADRLHDGVGRAGGRDEDAGRVGAGLADRLGDRVEDRDRAVERGLAALARRHAGDDLRAVARASRGRGTRPRGR